ncbi:putative holin-like toxin [Pectinatus sottacetonis]
MFRFFLYGGGGAVNTFQVLSLMISFGILIVAIISYTKMK